MRSTTVPVLSRLREVVSLFLVQRDVLLYYCYFFHSLTQ